MQMAPAVASKRRCGWKVPSPFPSSTETSLDEVFTTTMSRKSSTVGLKLAIARSRLKFCIPWIVNGPPCWNCADGELPRRLVGAVAVVHQHAEDVLAHVRHDDVEVRRRR